MKKQTCILLLEKGHDYLNGQAISFIQKSFEMRLVAECERRKGHDLEKLIMATEDRDVDYLFNFLSGWKVPPQILNSVGLAINFHPAPPEHPGVGCASYALYDALKCGKWEYGVTAHKMTDDFDAGEIYSTIRFPIYREEGCGAIFSRSFDYCLALLYKTVGELRNGKPVPNGEQWAHTATTRKQFEEFMKIGIDDKDFAEKIEAIKHPNFPGPFIRANGRVFGYYEK